MIATLSGGVRFPAFPTGQSEPPPADARVSAFLSVKLHRVDQVHPLGTEQRTAALVDILTEINRLGYPVPFIRRALNGIRNVRILDLAMLGQALYVYLAAQAGP